MVIQKGSQLNSQSSRVSTSFLAFNKSHPWPPETWTHSKFLPFSCHYIMLHLFHFPDSFHTDWWCKATLKYMDYGHYVGWCTEGKRRDQQPHSAPCQELLTHFHLEEIGSWREDSCQIREEWLGHFEICMSLHKNLWEEKRYQAFCFLFLGCCCSVTQSEPILCDPMGCSMPGLPGPHHLPKFAQVHVHCIKWCHPTISSYEDALSFCPQSFPASEIFQWVGSLHQTTKLLELQLQHQSFQWVFRVDVP